MRSSNVLRRGLRPPNRLGGNMRERPASSSRMPRRIRFSKCSLTCRQCSDHPPILSIHFLRGKGAFQVSTPVGCAGSSGSGTRLRRRRAGRRVAHGDGGTRRRRSPACCGPRSACGLRPGGLRHLLDRVGRDAARTYTALCEHVRNSFAVPADERSRRGLPTSSARACGRRSEGGVSFEVTAGWQDRRPRAPSRLAADS